MICSLLRHRTNSLAFRNDGNNMEILSWILARNFDEATHYKEPLNGHSIKAFVGRGGEAAEKTTFPTNKTTT